MGPINGNGDTNGHGPGATITPGGRLRRLLVDRDNIVIAPGVYDGFSARIALEVGFDCLYMVSLPQKFFVEVAKSIVDRGWYLRIQARSARSRPGNLE